ncbi:MAG TPA: hypothetical protein VN862_00085 [Candidatus Acidoferrales bacterium]|nr:hypothetical protein [Candidatus Acidoferrales bacterium]
MRPGTLLKAAAGGIAFASLGILSGCGLTLGPAYAIESQKIEVTYESARPELLAIQASYRLKNEGTRPIEALELELPAAQIFGTANIQVTWSGRGLHPDAAVEADHFRLAFGPGFDREKTADLAVSYELQVPADRAAVAPGAVPAIFLPSYGWYPVLQAPPGILGQGGAPPKQWDLVLRIPEGYRVYASGREHGNHRTGREQELRFSQKKEIYSPFAIAGPYTEERVSTSSGTVIFWTANPVPSGRAQKLAERIAADEKFLDEQFANAKSPVPVRIIECPPAESALTPRPWIAFTGCLPVPGSAVVDAGFLEGALDAGTGTEEATLHSIDMQLAASRFYFLARANPSGSPYPMAAAGDYAVWTLDLLHDARGRDASVRALLAQYGSSRPAHEKSLAAVSRNDALETRQAAHLKSALFFIALEDRCSSPHLRAALSRLMRVTSGGTWGVPELRSAMETECGANLADIFREWTDRPGIPADFQNHYASGAVSEAKQFADRIAHEK